jgi:hypothetical protein
VRRITLTDEDAADLRVLRNLLDQHRGKVAATERELAAKCKELIDGGRGSTATIAEVLGDGYTKSWVHVLATRGATPAGGAIGAAAS